MEVLSCSAAMFPAVAVSSSRGEGGGMVVGYSSLHGSISPTTHNYLLLSPFKARVVRALP